MTSTGNYIFYIYIYILILILFYLFFVGSCSMTMSRTTFSPSYFVFEHSEKMKLEEFKDLISVACYKIYESKVDKNPTWYSLT